MTAMTKTAVRAVNRQIRVLQRERLGWLAGHGLPWGVPWCAGPGSPYHATAADGSSICEGCGVRAYCSDRAAKVAEQIRQLQATLAPVVQGALW